MKDDKGKVIFSLIAGATAGIVAGLLLTRWPKYRASVPNLATTALLPP
jgi:hypothetical protein